MALLITGATGYIGAYVTHFVLEQSDEPLLLLVRADSAEHARERLWRALQLHMDFARFSAALARIRVLTGDLTRPGLGLSSAERDELVQSTDSVIHAAASLNRRSARACYNVNLRGTLALIQLARAAQDHHGLRRFSYVSTAAVAGRRRHELVAEERMVEWERSDYDSYARTKKFGEHMLRELLPDVPLTIFRPSTVLGDSRKPQTTQFDMVRAFALLADLPLLPLDLSWRLDVVPADWVGRAIAALHLEQSPRHDAYNLSSGAESPTYGAIVEALVAAGHPRRPRFVPRLYPAFAATAAGLMQTPRAWGLSRPAALLSVFLPYLFSDTVFDNRRAVQALGQPPPPFVGHAYSLLRWAREQRFRYPYRPWPDGG